MPRTPSDSTPTAPAPDAGSADACAGLGAEAVRVLQALRQSGSGRVVRIERALPGTDPLAWLRAQAPVDRFFWRARGEDRAWAGVGAAHVCTSLETLSQRLAGLPAGARYFGGMGFAPEHDGEPRWRPFGAARFVLPRFELHTGPDGSRLVMNIVPEDREAALEDAVRSLVITPSEAATTVPLPHARADAPGLPGWREAVGQALAGIASGEIEKVVLARRATFAFDEALDPFAVAAGLFAATPACYHFLFAPDDRHAFVGASPERLFRRDGARLETEALAGTRQRGSTPAEDRALRDELAASDKEAREHEVVLRSITRSLAPLAADLQASATAPLALATKWHLRCAVSGVLRPGAGITDVVRALHPTPAVNGHPADVAREHIARLEPFDRGWYAGPIGTWGRDCADVAVAIRSGLVRASGEGAELDLFSGAGIVAGSDPIKEWAEIEHKLIDFTRVLGLEA